LAKWKSREVAVSDQLESAKQPVSAALAGPYGHPFHPILVTVPIGAWVASLVFDIASRVVANPGFLNQGARWLIGLGVLGALAAASVGALDFMVIPARSKARHTAVLHLLVNLAVTASYAVNFLWRGQLATDEPVGAGPLALSVVSLAALGFSGYLGGKLVFRYGVRVAAESTQAEGYPPERQPE
jgi:uncharacterized membrane protein